MSTFVLVHGAWQGGWTWSRVAPLLRSRGHDVLTPTLTGVGERAHLLSRALSLDTHVQDVVSVIECERLSEIVLVGHSYGGQVIAGTASRLPEAISRLVYLDAFLPDDGQSATEEQPAKIATIYAESVEREGFGWLLPPRSLKALGVSEPQDIAWLERLIVPHPYRTFNDPVTVSEESLRIPSAYIECVEGIRVFQGQRAKALERGWPVYELPTGHQAMTTMPRELAVLLEEISELPG